MRTESTILQSMMNVGIDRYPSRKLHREPVQLPFSEDYSIRTREHLRRSFGSTVVIDISTAYCLSWTNT
jgi:hypothetical protein